MLFSICGNLKTLRKGSLCMLHVYARMHMHRPEGAVKSILLGVAGMVLACFWLMLHSQPGAEAAHVCTTIEASARQTHHLPVESSLMTKLR